jgi:lactoylglutathione lyase
MLTGVAHVAFRVANLERSLDFYCGKLGLREAFRLEREGRPSPWIVYLQLAENAFIELFPVPNDVVAQPTRGWYHHAWRSTTSLDRMSVPREDGDLWQPRLGVDNNWQYWVTDPTGIDRVDADDAGLAPGAADMNYGGTRKGNGCTEEAQRAAVGRTGGRARRPDRRRTAQSGRWSWRRSTRRRPGRR